MARRTTQLLSLLVLGGLLAALFASSRMSSLRDEAETAQRNLVAARSALSQIHQWRTSPGRAAAVTLDTSQLSAHLRDAARSADLPDAPGSEPDNNLRRLGDSDYSEMSVYLRFEPLTLRQLAAFLVTLARIDPTSRAKAIELSPPQGAAPAAGPGERWTADVTVGYLTYSPQRAAAAR